MTEILFHVISGAFDPEKTDGLGVPSEAAYREQKGGGVDNV